jgi:hypothetical protein
MLPLRVGFSIRADIVERFLRRLPSIFSASKAAALAMPCHVVLPHLRANPRPPVLMDFPP